jgi:hypothetical protein
VSVLVTGKFPCDTDAFRRFVANRGNVMKEISADGRSQGAIHHRFAIGDGFVLIIDEWTSVEAFQGFFQNQAEIPNVMQEAGAMGEPEFTFAELIETPDQF